MNIVSDTEKLHAFAGYLKDIKTMQKIFLAQRSFIYHKRRI